MGHPVYSVSTVIQSLLCYHNTYSRYIVTRFTQLIINHSETQESKSLMQANSGILDSHHIVTTFVRFETINGKKYVFYR